MNELLKMSATRLAEMIREQEVTSLEVMQTHIDRIRKVNPVLNAVVADRFDQALDEARRADQQTASLPAQELAPFHGVPCTIKECFALTGMPQSSGLVARKGFVADQDATAVARLRAAGAIPVGVTNLSELCMWYESNNRVYGRSNNPYDPGRIVGGSSGGEGAIVGAGGSPFGLGADIGGSIRMPAFFNGVFGHKPTGGMVPGTGQYPIAANQALRYLSTGPIARCAEDLMPLLVVLAGPDGIDQGSLSFELKDPSGVDVSGLPVLVVEENGATPVSKDLRQAQGKCAEALADRGAKVRHERIEGLKKSFDIWSAMLSQAGGPTFSELLGDGKPVHAFGQLMKWIVGRSPHTLPAIFLAMIENLPKLTPGRTQKMIDAGRALREELAERIGPEGVMLYPPFASPAPKHNGPLLRPFHFAYTAILNVMEMPATQVPVGLNKQGLPLGVQVAALHGNDHLTIAVAMELEKALGGWTPPPSLDALDAS